MKAGLSVGKILLFLGVVAGAMVLSYLVDDNLGMAWPANVVRNWQEFGLATLHGQMVYNPGGFEALEHPQIYKGMDPVSLYPAYFASKIFGWTGQGVMAFHILLLLAVVWGAWNLLGRDNFAMMVALAAVLCPGYLRWPKILDPNTLAALPAIPYAVLALVILKKPKFTPALAVLLLILTVGFMSLNWTTGWVCAPCLVLFFGTPGVNRRGLAFLTGLMVIGIPAVVGLSFMAKAGGGQTGVGNTETGHVLGGYTWGSGGYGEGLTTGKAFLLLAFVNAIGLLPMWLALVYAAGRRVQNGARLSPIVFAPLALTMADVIIMRNYFGHHPWMAAPVLLVGLIFSLALVRNSPEWKGDVLGNIPFKFVVTLIVLCFIYGFAVLTFFRTNETQLLGLAELVRGHTERSDTIILVKSADPATARLVDRLEEPLDRHIVVVDDFKDIPAEKSNAVILSASPLDGSFTMTAQSAGHSQSFMNKVADWFNHSIARRKAGDRLELAETYYLYAPP